MTQPARAVVVLLCGVVAACAGSRAIPKPQRVTAPTGEQLLEAMAEHYAASHTYEDRGTVANARYPDDGSSPHFSRMDFQTAFNRETGGFRFEYTQAKPFDVRGVIWRSVPGPARVWWTIQPEVRVEELFLAIAGFTGVTERAAYEIPTMLLGKGPVHKGLAFKVDGEEIVNGTTCAKLSVRDDASMLVLGCDSDLIVLWIGRTDRLLYKFFERRHFKGAVPGVDLAARLPPDLPEATRESIREALRNARPFAAETTIEYFPVIDRAVDQAKFEFTPPATPPPSLKPTTAATDTANRRHDYCAGQDLVAKGTDPLIDDLEDGDGYVRQVDGRGGEWYVFADSGCVLDPPERPRTAPDIPPAPSRSTRSKFAMRVEGHGCTDWGFGVGAQLHHVEGPSCAYNATVYDGIYFWARSGKGPASVRFQAGTRLTIPSNYGGDGSCETKTEKDCWDYHSASVALTPDWKLYAFKWADLKQAGWGKAATFDAALLTNLQWQSDAKKEQVEIWVDQVGFFKGDYPKK